MRWEVQGAAADTGRGVKLLVEAATAEAEGRLASQRGVAVRAVRPAAAPQPAADASPAEQPGTAAASAHDMGVPKWLYALLAAIAVAGAVAVFFVLRPKGDLAGALADGRGGAGDAPAAAAVEPGRPPQKRSAVPQTRAGRDQRGQQQPAKPKPAARAAAAAPANPRQPTAAADNAARRPSPPTAVPATLGLSYEEVVRDLDGTFPMRAKRKTDGTPMYEGVAEGVGMLHVFGDAADVTEASLALALPRVEETLRRNMAVGELFLRNAVPEWDRRSAAHWLQQAVLKAAQDADGKASTTVGRKRVWVTGIPTDEGLLAVVGVSPADPAEVAAAAEMPAAADADLERALAHRAAAERRQHKTLGMTYDEVLAGVEDSFDMQPALPADGLPGYYGSTGNQALTIRVSGHKADVAAVGFTMILGGEAQDGVANVVAMSLVVHNVCPRWKGFLDWLNENKLAVLETPKKVVTHREGDRLVRLSGLVNRDFGAQMLFIEIVPAE